MTIPRASLLRRALDAHAEFGSFLPSYGQHLERLGRWDDAGAQFDRLAKKYRPKDQDQFAIRLLSLVMFAALDAALVLPSGGTPTILERRAMIEKRYGKLLSAIDTLDRAFEMPNFEIETLESGEIYSETSIEIPGGVPDDNPFLRSSVEAWQVALGLANPTSIDNGQLWAVLYQTHDAPAALQTMRVFLTCRKLAELEALTMGTLSRKTSGVAHVRTFVILLNKRLLESFGFKDVGFLTVMANALFGTEDLEKVEMKDSEFFEDGVKKILERASRRSKKA